MTRRSLWSAILLPLFVAACGPGEVTVSSEVERFNPDTGEPELRPVERMPVQLIPFDRDAMFDSLAQAAPTPEPQMPAEVREAQQEILAGQQDHREAETQVLALRERLLGLTNEMREYSQAEPRYRELFAQFNELEAQLEDAEERRDDAFERWTTRQREAIEEIDRFRIQLEEWEEEAFADYGEVVARRLQETRREILADTTDATGRATFNPSPGTWWVYARHTLATEELYWNIRVDVERGDPVEILLTRDNAEIRDVF
jgi:hypothetical protein